MKPTPTLVISGPVGVGKTTVANEVSTSLAQAGVAHTFIDLDTLTMTYPRPSDDRFGGKLAVQNLRDVWANCAAAGSRNLVIARVIETTADLEKIQQALPNTKLCLCQLHATDQTLIERIHAREHGPERDWHEARAVELARALRNTAPADYTIDTDGRSAAEIARDLVQRIEWATSEGAARGVPRT